MHHVDVIEGSTYRRILGERCYGERSHTPARSRHYGRLYRAAAGDVLYAAIVYVQCLPISRRSVAYLARCTSLSGYRLTRIYRSSHATPTFTASDVETLEGASHAGGAKSRSAGLNAGERTYRGLFVI